MNNPFLQQMYRHECPPCEEVIEESSGIKERAKEHIKHHHRTEVENECFVLREDDVHLQLGDSLCNVVLEN
jgi:hypothetical protein